MSCEHCINGKSFYHAEDHGMTADISMCDNTLIADLYSDYAQFPIKFCPDCGEPLDEPAPLTLEELEKRDKPVWVRLDPPCIDDCKGYWCLCKDGYITPPSCMGFEAKYRPSWTFYDRPPKEQST